MHLSFCVYASDMEGRIFSPVLQNLQCFQFTEQFLLAFSDPLLPKHLLHTPYPYHLVPAQSGIFPLLYRSSSDFNSVYAFRFILRTISSRMQLCCQYETVYERGNSYFDYDRHSRCLFATTGSYDTRSSSQTPARLLSITGEYCSKHNNWDVEYQKSREHKRSYKTGNVRKQDI